MWLEIEIIRENTPENKTEQMNWKKSPPKHWTTELKAFCGDPHSTYLLCVCIARLSSHTLSIIWCPGGEGLPVFLCPLASSMLNLMLQSPVPSLLLHYGRHSTDSYSKCDCSSRNAAFWRNLCPSLWLSYDYNGSQEIGFSLRISCLEKEKPEAPWPAREGLLSLHKQC